MRAAPTLLSWLYCLSVVLLPYLHFLFDAHGTEVTVSAACSGHAHEHGHEPAGKKPDANDDGCLLCKFLAAENETSERAPDLQPNLGMVFVQASADESYACILTRTHRARAPPFMTV